MKKTLFFFAILQIVSCNHFYAQTKDADVQILKNKLVQFILPKGIRTEDKSKQNAVVEMMNSCQLDGSWKEIDYKNNSRAEWQPGDHWKKILKMAIAYKDKSSSLYNDSSLCKVILCAMEFWTREKPESDNYWWNAIGVQNELGPAALLMEEIIPLALKNEIIDLLNYAVKPTFYYYHGVATGQNLLWIANAHIYSSVLANDTEGLKRVFSEVAKEIKITTDEGIQADYSFHQHGPQLYSFGYGKAFVQTATNFIYFAYGTKWQLPTEKQEIISNYLLEGQQWMSRNLFFDYNAFGREITRNNFSTSTFPAVCALMGDFDKSKKPQYDAFANQIKTGKRAEPLVGNRYFYRSDMMVHQRKNYYFSVKGTSDRIFANESGNGENLKGAYLGRGTTYIVRNGDEYKAIFPVWKWRMIPGLLCEQSDAAFPQFKWGVGSKGKTPFVYGISDGLYGCFGYDYALESVTAKRAWFMFDKEIVCLVGGLNCTSEYDLVQTVNQCLAKSEVVIDGKSSAIETQTLVKANWILQDSVAYYFKNIQSPILVENRLQTGSWKSITDVGSKEIQNKKVFTLSFNLGKKVENVSFSYAILPGVGAEEMKKYAFDKEIKLIANDSSLQAVYHKSINQLQAVFYKPGYLKLPWNNLTLELKKPGLVIIRRKGNVLEINLSQPPFSKKITLEIIENLKVTNENFCIK